MNVADAPIRCSANPELTAAAWCSVCNLPFAGRFMATRLDGRAVCRSCAEREEVELWPLESDAKAAASPGAQGLILKLVALPARDAPELTEGPAGPAMWAGFGYTVAGYVMTVGWTYLLAFDAVQEQTAAMVAELGEGADPRMATWAMWAQWLVIPFVAGLRVLLGAAALHAGVRWVIGAGAEAWTAHARFWGLSSAALLLCVVPSFGPIAAMLVWSMATMAMLQRRYGVTPIRGTAAMLPAIGVVLMMGPVPAC